MDKNIAFSSALSLSSQLSKCEISVTELTKEIYNRINKYNNSLNSIVINNEKEALETAAKLDDEIKEGKKRGPLHGIPVTFKESFNLKGHKTTV
ncbi:MAG: amidase, partial [Cyclobacteriaceae bacterium]|nr:amidase [Cyclobacteriaceae bacterium]